MVLINNYMEMIQLIFNIYKIIFIHSYQSICKSTLTIESFINGQINVQALSVQYFNIQVFIIMILKKLAQLFKNLIFFNYLPYSKIMNQQISEVSPLPESFKNPVGNTKLCTIQSSKVQRVSQQGYQDFSQIVQHYYAEQKKQNPVNFAAEIGQLDEWVKLEGNRKPLVISSDDQSGKKTLMCQFINHLSKHNNLIVLAQFASVNSVYSEILSNLTTKIKKSLDITQKVQLNQEKLRRYFKYWLEIAGSRCQKQSIAYQYQKKKQIIIFIEGIDLAEDSKGQSVAPTFWLPSDFPKHVKMVVSANKKSKAAIFFQENGCQIIDYTVNKQKKKKIVMQINKSLEPCCQTLSLMEIKIVNKLIKNFPKFKIDFSGKNMQQILKQYISVVKTPNLQQKIISNILFVLSVSRKGLSFSEIQVICKIDTDTLNQFLDKFDGMVSVFEQIFSIWQPRLKKIIKSIVDPNNQRQKSCRLLISKILKRRNQTTRTLQQTIYQLIGAQNFIELKQILSKIDNFLLLYTPDTKNLLCACWNKLESLQHDPVFQYNKAIQNFLNHYYLKEQQVFKIIFAVSLFFKEYADFQNAKTPQFRHPYIRGQNTQLNSICMLEQLNKLKMIKKQREILKKKEGVPKIGEKKKQKQGKRQNRDLNNGKVETYTNPVDQKSEVAQSDKCLDGEQLDTKYQEAKFQCDQFRDIRGSLIKQIEGLNINIVSSQEKFRETYIKIMSDFLTKYYTSNRNASNEDYQKTFKVIANDEDSDQEIQKETFEGKQIDSEIQKIKESLILKSFSEYREENYHKNGEEPKYYYYKQWIWLQFPWIGQSISSDFSKLIQQCITSPTEYMSIKRQEYLMRQAVRVAKIAKQNKMQIYRKNKSQDQNVCYAKEEKSINQNPSLISKRSQVSLKQKKQLNNSTSAPHQNHLQNASINYAKWKLNLNEVRYQIAKNSVNSTGRPVRSKKDNISYNASSFFVTENNESLGNSILKKSNSASRFQLPKISDGRSMIKSGIKNIKKRKRQFNYKENDSECQSSINQSKLQEQDQKSLNTVIRKYNQIKSENSILIKKVESLKNSLIMIEDGRNKNRQEKLEQQVRKLEQQKISIKKTFDHQHTLKQKLETILKICNINKAHGSQSQELNKFLSSLKFMIGIQQKNNEQIRIKLNTAVEQYRCELKIIREAKKQFEKNIVNQRRKDKINTLKTQKFIQQQKQMGERLQKINKKKSQTIIKSSTGNQPSTSKTKKQAKISPNIEQINQKNLLMKNVQQLEKELQRMNISFGSNDQNQKILNQFQYGIYKSIQLFESKIEQIQTLGKTKEAIQQCQTQLMALSKKGIYDKISKMKQQITSKKQRLQAIKYRKNVLSVCLSCLGKTQC